MALFSLAQRTTNTTIANAAWEVIAGAGVKPKVLEFGVSATTGASSVYGVGRPGATGLVPTTPQSFLNEEYADGPVGTTRGALAWGTPPTVPANFFRRLNHSTTIGSGTIYVFPRGLAIPAGTSIVLWNIASNGAVDAWAVLDE